MDVQITNRQNRLKIQTEKLKRTAGVILDGLAYPDAELSIVLVDDPEIAGLNQEYLSREGPTNVIAFPMREGAFTRISPNLLGDVVISTDTVLKEAFDAGMDPEDRLNELLVHGILHLVGYDHEDTVERAGQMEEKSRELLLMISERREKKRV